MALSTLLSIVAVGLLAAGLSLGACLAVGARRGWRAGAVLGLIRVAMLACLAFFLWKVFIDYEQREDEEDDPGEERRVVLLQDRSASMGFSAAPGQTRHQLADDVWGQLQALAKKEDDPPEVRRYFYGRNLTTEEGVGRLLPDATQTGMAVSQVLARQRVDALLLVSDGAATDGEPPGYLLDWAGNRNIGLYAVCSAPPSSEQFDLMVTETRCKRNNPERLEATVASIGGDDAMRVQIEIDGKLVRELKVASREQYKLQEPVPASLAVGWHEYAVKVRPAPGEITELNNVQRGIFQVLPADRLLFLHDEPRLENLHLVRLLRTRFPERLAIASVHDREATTLDRQGYRLVILGDVHPAQLPGPVLEAIRSRQLLCLVLAGSQLKNWRQELVPSSPISSVRGRRNLLREKADEATVRVTDQERADFKYLELDGLTLNLFHEVVRSRGSWELLTIQTGKGAYPLLMADKGSQPSYVVFLAETTWKWALHPDPRTRGQYRALWGATFNWLLGEAGTPYDLALGFGPDPESQRHTLVELTATLPDALAELKRPTIEVLAPWRAKLPKPRLEGEALVQRFEDPADRPLVVWFQASGEHRGRQLESQRTPLLLEMNAREQLDTRTHPELLRRLVRERDANFAFHADSKRVVATLLKSLERAAEKNEVRLRNTPLELLLTGFVALLLGLEWFVERRLKDNLARP